MNETRLRKATIAGAVLGALGASACCLGPALLALVGLSGVGVAAAFEPYRPVLLGASAALLGLGFYLTYRRRRTAPAQGGDACCPAPRTTRSARAFLWTATILVAGFAAYPYVAAAVAGRSSRRPAPTTAGVATARVHVAGMTCGGCASQIAEALTKVPGVTRANVDYEAATAVVAYDPRRIDAKRLVAAIAELGYGARLESGASSGLGAVRR